MFSVLAYAWLQPHPPILSRRATNLNAQEHTLADWPECSSRIHHDVTFLFNRRLSGQDIGPEDISPLDKASSWLLKGLGHFPGPEAISSTS